MRLLKVPQLPAVSVAVRMAVRIAVGVVLVPRCRCLLVV